MSALLILKVTFENGIEKEYELEGYIDDRFFGPDYTLADIEDKADEFAMSFGEGEYMTFKSDGKAYYIDCNKVLSAEVEIINDTKPDETEILEKNDEESGRKPERKLMDEIDKLLALSNAHRKNDPFHEGAAVKIHEVKNKVLRYFKETGRIPE